MKTISNSLVKGLLFVALITAVSIFNTYAQKIKGSGTLTSQDRDVASFNKISAGGVLKLILIQSVKESVTIKAEDNIIDHITTKVSGHELVIGMNENLSPSEDITVTIYAKNVKGLDISGVVDFETQGTLKTDELEIDCSGASTMHADISVNNLEGDISGSSKITLSGNAGSVDMDISGAVVLNAFDLKTGKCEFEVSGAAKCEISCDEELEVEVSGAATLVYKGDPKVEKSVSGVATISKK